MASADDALPISRAEGLVTQADSGSAEKYFRAERGSGCRLTVDRTCTASRVALKTQSLSFLYSWLVCDTAEEYPKHSGSVVDWWSTGRDDVVFSRGPVSPGRDMYKYNESRRYG